jgi:WD40 repeat protein
VSKADTGASLFELSGHRERVVSAAFSGAAGSSVVTASADGTARVWDAVLQPEVDKLARVGSAVRALGFPRPDVLRVEWRGGTSMFGAKTGKRLDRGAMPSASTSPRVRAQSQDGSTAAIRGNTVVLRVDGRTTILKGHADQVLAVSFSPDGSLLATASRDRDVRIWNVATGETVRILPHNSAVRDVEFSPNGRWLVTAAAKATLWDARDGDIVVRLQTNARIVTAAMFDPSGLRIVTGDRGGGVGTYKCGVCGGLDELMALAERRLARTGRQLTAAERERYLR